jgi:hypothetical protein
MRISAITFAILGATMNESNVSAGTPNAAAKTNALAATRSGRHTRKQAGGRRASHSVHDFDLGANRLVGAGGSGVAGG